MSKFHLTSANLSDVDELVHISSCAHCRFGFLATLSEFFGGLFGSENVFLSAKIEETRKIAVERLISRAQQIQADGVMNLRYELSGHTTVLVYGTAYRNKKEN